MYNPLLVSDRQQLARELLTTLESMGLSEVGFGRGCEFQYGIAVGLFMVRVNTTVDHTMMVDRRGKDSIKVFITRQDGNEIIEGAGLKTKQRKHRVGTIQAICQRVQLEVLEYMSAAEHLTVCPEHHPSSRREAMVG